MATVEEAILNADRVAREADAALATSREATRRQAETARRQAELATAATSPAPVGALSAPAEVSEPMTMREARRTVLAQHTSWSSEQVEAEARAMVAKLKHAELLERLDAEVKANEAAGDPWGEQASARDRYERFEAQISGE